LLVAHHIAAEVPSQDLVACRDAVKRRPKSGSARLDLARASLAADDPAEAVEQCAKALELKPGLRDAAWLLASLLQRYEINESIDVSTRGLRAALQFVDVDKQALCTAAIATLKHASPLSDAVAVGRAEGWPEAARTVLSGKGRKLLQDRLFRAALTSGINTDVEVEFLLTALRQALLEAPERMQDRPVYEFACVLIQQCANNSYVFHATEAEKDRLAALPVNPDALFEGKAASAGGFMLAALYKPLTSLIDPALAARGTKRILPRALRPIIALAIEADREEAETAATLPALTPVTDGVSQRVADQYRTAPYPRWLSLQVPQPGSARRFLADYFSDAETKRLETPCDVLIAGAGTCRQAVHAAIAYGAQARVHAIDLSTPSLAYGARMAQRLGVENIRFATADILRLGETEETYDVIECAGVLHHMADPYAAWRILLDRLKLSGLLKIGLYSDVSRKTIAALSDDPEWPGSDASDDALRTFRHRLMQRPKGAAGSELTASIDFFATNDFRDLALHVQEQRCALPDIRDFLANNRLEIRGFILPPDVHRMYRDMFPDYVKPGSLDHWWQFEQHHPRTFDGMYMFWCRKSESGS